MVIIPQPGTITAAAGTGNATITTKHDLIQQIFVKAATTTTTFDVKLTDRYDNVVYKTTDITGELNDVKPELGTYGNLTLTIENASVDEAFTYLFSLRS